MTFYQACLTERKQSQKKMICTELNLGLMNGSISSDSVTHLNSATSRKDAGHVLFLRLTSLAAVQFALSLCNLPRAEISSRTQVH